jgi:hypothetical protein
MGTMHAGYESVFVQTSLDNFFFREHNMVRDPKILICIGSELGHNGHDR